MLLLHLGIVGGEGDIDVYPIVPGKKTIIKNDDHRVQRLIFLVFPLIRLDPLLY